MRTYKTVIGEEKKVIDKIYCNACGSEIKKDIHGYAEDHLHVEKTWEYQSHKDGVKHSFDICEACYDKWIATFYDQSMIE